MRVYIQSIHTNIFDGSPGLGEDVEESENATDEAFEAQAEVESVEESTKGQPDPVALRLQDLDESLEQSTPYLLVTECLFTAS